jgi:hypothetical protein
MKMPLTLSPCLYPGLLLVLILNIACREKDISPGVAPSNESEVPAGKNAGEVYQPLITHRYTADPSAHVFEGKLFIYPSHDYESGIPADDLGSHFNMKDYHVFSMTNLPGEVTDHGKTLTLEDIPWAEKQLWAPDAAFKDGTYFFYFPAKDRDDIFRIGVATASEPQGPFVAQKEPIKNSYSIDPAVFRDTDGTYYMYFGGIWGGQLQRWASGSYRAEDSYPANDEPALMPKIARLSDDMLQFAESPKEVQVLDQEGNPLLAGDNDRRFFEAAWVHKYREDYYLSYSTGDTHNIVYAVSDNPYGPFTYKGVVLKPVLGWTNHHSIVHYQGKWWLFFHDSSLSGGQTHLRSIKMAPLEHLPDGSIKIINAMVEPID